LRSDTLSNPILEVGTAEFLKLQRLLIEIFPRHCAVERKRFVIDPLFLDRIVRGDKTTTIRYQANSVEYPSANVLPMVPSSSTMEALDAVNVRVVSVCYKPFAQLDLDDAKRDGFVSLSELKEALQGFYGPLRANDILSIFNIIPERELKSQGSPRVRGVST
jgi:hypothetical protein